MAIAWYRYLDLAAPPTARERRSSDTSAGSVSPEPRGLEVRRLRPRGLFSFASPSLKQRTARDGDALTYPLSHVRVLTRDEFAAVHGDGGKDESFGLTVAPLAAPNNGARGNP